MDRKGEKSNHLAEINLVPNLCQGEIGPLLFKGWGVMFASKFNCVFKICFSSVWPEILKVCELACQIYIPGKA
jgi:hypothetical protein